MTTQPGKRDEIIAILLESGKTFDSNPACELYLVSKDQADDNVIWVQDVWITQEAHQQAMSSEGMKAYIARAVPLLHGMPEQHVAQPAGGKHPFA